MQKITRVLTGSIVLGTIILGGGITAQEADPARLETAAKVRELIEQEDIYAAIEFIQYTDEYKEVVQRYYNLTFDLYWHEKAVHAMVPVAQAGIYYCMTKSKKYAETDPELAGKLKSFVKILSFNLASFTWPAWNEEGITVTEADMAAGLDAAKLNVRISKELNEGPQPVSVAYWSLGAHYLAAGKYEEAIGAFSSASDYAIVAEDDAGKLMNRGYIEMTRIVGNDDKDAKREFKKMVKELRKMDTEDSAFHADQLEDILEYFIGD